MDGKKIKKFKKRSITLYRFHVARRMKEQFWKFELYFEVIVSSRKTKKMSNTLLAHVLKLLQVTFGQVL